MKLRIQKIDAEAVLPRYAIAGDAGLDLYSAEEMVIETGNRCAVKTGIKMEISEGYAGLIWDRSGLAVKSGITTMAGVIDANYRGEVAVVLYNTGDMPFEVKKGMRIAQMLIQKVESPEIEAVEALNETNRGENGFGSTGE